jgi:two-component system, cell cycle response regulator
MDYSPYRSLGSQRHPSPTDSTVLVVDDDVDIVDFVATALITVGYHVLAGVGADALQIAQLAHPDVILMDLRMPGIDGIEMSRRLRAHPETADIPIVAMSAQDFPRDSGFHALVNDRLSKPFHLKDLYGAVALWSGPDRAKLYFTS